MVPASCLEVPDGIPAPKEDLYLYSADLIVALTKSGVLREQCRAALLDAAGIASTTNQEGN